MRRARRLIDRSGTAGTKVTVWAYGPRRRDAALLRLAASPPRLSQHAPPLPGLQHVLRTGRRLADTGADRHQRIHADFPAPSGFIALFACASIAPRSSANTNLSGFCDPGFEAQVEAALDDRDPDANLSWQRAYARLADAAPSCRSSTAARSSSSPSASATINTTRSGGRYWTSSGSDRYLQRFANCRRATQRGDRRTRRSGVCGRHFRGKCECLGSAARDVRKGRGASVPGRRIRWESGSRAP